MKWRDISEADLNGALAFVLHGHDPDAARNLIEYFHECIHEREPYNEGILLELLDHAFGKIVREGWSADHAFGLKLKRGKRQRPDTTERDVIAAAYMILLIRNGWTWLDAKGQAANLLFPDGRGEKAVEAAYALCKEEFEPMSDELLIDMLPQGTPVISCNMTG